MLRKLFGLLGLGAAVASVSVAAQPSTPYPAGSAASSLYALLFCDDLVAFRPNPSPPPAAWQALLYGEAQDPSKIEALATDPVAESRVRALAYEWLRSHGRSVRKGDVLGVIIEVPMGGGLDVVAAYADGSVRYLNHSGKVAVVEPGSLTDVNRTAQELVGQSSALVARIGPWDKPRLPAPRAPNMRISFVVSDGLYFGEGPVSAMEKDPMAGPLIQRGALIVKFVTDKVVSQP